MLPIKMLALKKDKVGKFILNNLGNIVLFAVLFGAFKKVILSENYIRGTLIDYTLIKIYISSFIFLLIILYFLRLFLKKIFCLVTVFILILVNILFSQNPLFSLIYLFNYLPILIFFLMFSSYKFSLSYKLVFLVNLIYIGVFIIQLKTSTSFFPYLPFGFFKYAGVSPNLDFFSFFGTKVVLPIANFPHANVFAAFLSFLNISHFYNKKIYFLFINLILVTVLSSFASILFNIVLLVWYIKAYVPVSLPKKYLTWILFFLISLSSLYFFSFSGFKFVSISERISQLQVFLYIIAQYPLFGIGLNNSISSINLFEVYKGSVFVLQPIHNIFLLLLLEGGLFTTSLIVLFLYKQKNLLKITPYLVFIFILGSFDHYFLTLYQGLVVFALTILLHKSIINNSNV